jgi:hypothetical protein
LIARDNQDAHMLDKAIRDFDCSRLLNGEEGIALGMQLLTTAVAAETARSAGRDEDAERYLAAGEALSQLPIPDNAACYEGLWAHFRSRGQPEKAAEAIRQIGRFPGYGCVILAVDCLERLDSDGALAEFNLAISPEHKDSIPVQLARAHLLPCTPANKRHTRELASQLLKSESSFVGLLALYALSRMADPKEVETCARDFATKIKQIPHSDINLFKNVACIDFLADGDERKLLETVRDSELAKSQAYFTMGMWQLMHSRHDAALKQFTLAVKTNAVGTYGYEWARAYKAHMVREPAWPNLVKPVREE